MPGPKLLQIDRFLLVPARFWLVPARGGSVFARYCPEWFGIGQILLSCGPLLPRTALYPGYFISMNSRG
jgi:hypothetical protein